jgi:hypothetical protein
MVPPNLKADALQAMTLVEYSATLTTMGLFGFIFSSFADVGKSYLTFYCNAVRFSILSILSHVVAPTQYYTGSCNCRGHDTFIIHIPASWQ